MSRSSSIPSSDIPEPSGLASCRLLRVSEAAGRLGVSSRTIQNWVTAGRIRVVHLSARAVRITEEELAAFILHATGQASGGTEVKP